MTLRNVEFEQSIIGGLLIDPDQLADIQALLTTESFTSPLEKVAYAGLAILSQNGHRIDFLTVADECEKTMPTGNWLTYLATMAKNCPSSANLLTYAKAVRDYQYLRQMHEAGEAVSRAALSPGQPSERIAAAQQAIQNVLKIDAGIGPLSTKQAFQEWIQRLIDQGDGKHAPGLMTGFVELDNLTTGFHPGELVIMAARPGQGKTVLALQMAGHAMDAGLKVMFFSLEMQTHELISRLVSCQTRISHHAIKSADLDGYQWDMVTEYVNRAQNRQLFISDKGDQNINEIRAQARAQRNKSGLDLVIVDYLQLAHGDGENDVVRVGNVSRGLKALAKELNCPVIALSQFSRAVEQRTDGRPRLSDLRSSGQIEQDADLVMFLHRADEHTTELIVEKNRHGRTGSAWLSPKFGHMRFEPGYKPAEVDQPKKRGLEF